MRILLFGDAPMAVNEGGFPQTLYNLFCFIKPENFLGITAIEKKDFIKIGEPFSKRYINYRYIWIKTPRNRLGIYLNPIISWLNYSICKLQTYSTIKNQIRTFNPDIIISCSNLSIGVLMHNKLFGSGNFDGIIVPYFMDDWMYKNNQKWILGDVHSSIKKILHDNKNWIMIGKELSEILQERYEVKPLKEIYLRNPVDLPIPFSIDFKDLYRRKQKFIIAYAGSLWNMHYDSFLYFAKAVRKISEFEDVEIVLYTQQMFWDTKKEQLDPLNVKYGGHKEYFEIHNFLLEADALLITSSFDEAYYTHSKASLQTKLTDYSKAGRLIISCGPEYSANNNFIKEKDCGICIETSNIKEIVFQLSNVIKNIDSYQYMVKNAYNTLKELNKDAVHKKIQTFLESLLP